MTSFYEQYWTAAVPFGQFLESVEEKADLWRSYADRARLHADELARVSELPAARQILVLAEDWCGDAIRSVPTIVALAEAAENVEVRILDSDRFPAALTQHLTKGARAIPIAVVFDEHGEQIGVWGPRPAALQAELRAKLRTEGAPSADDKGEFYAPIMAWYAKDRGRTVAQELLMLLERGGQP